MNDLQTNSTPCTLEYSESSAITQIDADELGRKLQLLCASLDGPSDEPCFVLSPTEVSHHIRELQRRQDEFDHWQVSVELRLAKDE